MAQVHRHAATGELRFSGTVYDYDSGPPVARGKFGVWLFLATEVMFFTGLIGAYIVLRGGAERWPDPQARLAVNVTAANTFALIASSATMVLAVRAAVAGARGRLLGWLAATILLGTIFVGVQAYEYRELLLAGSAPNVDLFWSTFFVMTGFHGLHVCAGILWLAWLWMRATAKAPGPGQALRVELAGLYWHFVDLVWVVLFTLLYLM